MIGRWNAVRTNPDAVVAAATGSGAAGVAVGTGVVSSGTVGVERMNSGSARTTMVSSGANVAAAMSSGAVSDELGAAGTAAVCSDAGGGRRGMFAVCSAGMQQ